jgi:hypothetical protein
MLMNKKITVFWNMIPLQPWQKIKARVRKTGMDVVRHRTGTRALSEPMKNSIKNTCFFKEPIPLKHWQLSLRLHGISS